MTITEITSNRYHLHLKTCTPRPQEIYHVWPAKMSVPPLDTLINNCDGTASSNKNIHFLSKYWIKFDEYARRTSVCGRI